MESRQVSSFQSYILITLGASLLNDDVYDFVWDWLPFHLGYYIFALGILQLLKIGPVPDASAQLSFIQALILLIWGFSTFETGEFVAESLAEIPIHFGHYFLTLGFLQLAKIQEAESPQLSLLQALLLIFWGAGFFEAGRFVWDFLPPYEFGRYILALGILQFLKTMDMPEVSSTPRGSSRPSYASPRRQDPSPILSRPSGLIFAPGPRESTLAPPKRKSGFTRPPGPREITIECPECSVRMTVRKLGKLQNVKCKSCGISGEIKI